MAERPDRRDPSAPQVHGYARPTRDAAGRGSTSGHDTRIGEGLHIEAREGAEADTSRAMRSVSWNVRAGKIHRVAGAREPSMTGSVAAPRGTSHAAEITIRPTLSFA